MHDGRNIESGIIIGLVYIFVMVRDNGIDASSFFPLYYFFPDESATSNEAFL